MVLGDACGEGVRAFTMDDCSLRHRMLEAIGQIEEALGKDLPDETKVAPSPWRSFFFGGDDGGGLYVLACSPGAGRRTLGASLVAEFLRTTRQAPTLAWFSLCEPAVEATIRLLSLSAGFSPEAVAKGQARSREHLRRLMTTAGRLAEHPVLIDDSQGLSVSDLWERCREWEGTHGGCRPILIDGGDSLLNDFGMAGDSDPEVAAEIARDLRRFAEEFGAPVIVLITLDESTPIDEFTAPWREHAELIATLGVDEPDPQTGVVSATLRILKPGGDSDRLITPLIFRTFLMGLADEESDEESDEDEG